MEIKNIDGGICAPKGFKAAGIHSGITKKPDKKDLALIYSEKICGAAGVYTKNKVKAAPIIVTKANLEDNTAQAVICNSGNANACTSDGTRVARKMCELAALELGISSCDVIVASTGVIGQPLSIAPVEKSIKALAGALSENGSGDASSAIMTTDILQKQIAVSFNIGGKECRIGAIAKGSGMIHPNMGTMLSFITTDTAISKVLLDKALKAVTEETFNMVCVDGDTSTNDMAVILANGLAENSIIDTENEDYNAFLKALMHVCKYIARIMAKDGEGATKLIECSVSGAIDDENAKILAKSVIKSSLVKAAMFGADANWGRILCALGYSGAELDPKNVNVTFVSEFGSIEVCKNGSGIYFDESKASGVLSANEIEIKVNLHSAQGKAVAWGCDLTYDYVKINGDYRS